jgi:hypothetical protein
VDRCGRPRRAVLAGGEIDDRAGGVDRSEHGVLVAATVPHLEVDAASTAVEGAQEFVGEPLALGRSQRREHGEPGVEVDREGAVAEFDDDPLTLH